MTRFLLDSNNAGEYLQKRGGVFDRARIEVGKGNTIGITLPVLAELVAGIENSRTRERNMKSLEVMLPSLKLWPLDAAAAFEYGRIYADLVRTGRPMGVIDMMIASIARVLGNCTVVTCDSDLHSIPGLRIENWRL